MDSSTEALPTSFREDVEASLSRGLERILVSVSAAIDRGELSPAFLVIGCGLGAGVAITALRGGTVSFLHGLVRLEPPA